MLTLKNKVEAIFDSIAEYEKYINERIEKGQFEADWLGFDDEPEYRYRKLEQEIKNVADSMVGYVESIRDKYDTEKYKKDGRTD